MGDDQNRQIASELEGQVAPALHIPDAVRVGVIACTEADGLWLQGHLMACEGGRAPLIDLFLMRPAGGVTKPGEIPCAKARDVMIRYLEGGAPPDDAAFAHIAAGDL